MRNEYSGKRPGSTCAQTGVVYTMLVLASVSFSACGGDTASPVASRRADVAVAPATNSSIATEKPADPRHDGESYARVAENPFLEVAQAPLSTFSIDVDTASYANVRRFLDDGQMPPPDAVRVEEMINYFEYDYPQPAGDVPFGVVAEVSECPWNREHRLLHIGLKGREIAEEKLLPSNLVFLIDTSGSMNSLDKLPLLQRAFDLLVDQLTERDRVAIVAYAGSSGLVLESTPADRKGAIKSAIGRLTSGGSTNGGEGIRLAYETARRAFIQGGNNRVILATDGDFNVGVTNQNDLVRLIEEQRESGIYLTVIGLGTGNLKDSTMEKLADKGNGNYAYFDSIEEARKVFGREMGATLHTIARDVKIQVEFNPRQVSGYRLVGYENRVLEDRDFNDDTKDAGEIGAGHTVTALYEIVPVGRSVPRPDVDSLKYQRPGPTPSAVAGELATIKLRYKEPAGDRSSLLSVAVVDSGSTLATASENLRFASAVAEFGLLLRTSRYVGDATYDDVLALARPAVGADLENEREEFLQLVGQARRLSGGRATRP